MVPDKKYSLFILLLFIIKPCSAQVTEIYIEGYDQLRYSVEKITVSPGIAVKLTLKTVSSLPKKQMAHNWVLLKQHTDIEKFVNQSVQHQHNEYIEPEMKNRIIATTSMLAGGEQETITFTAPNKKGEYIYVCTFPGHYIAGMKGKLIVK